MLPKPAGCLDCPLYGDGQGFVPDELVAQAPLLLYFQNPGVEEESQGRPLVGKTGQMMERNFFPLLDVQRGEVSLGNAIRCRWKHQNTLVPLASPMGQQAVTHCTHAHHRLPEGTKAILASGEYAVAALTGLTRNFAGWRGYTVPYAPRQSREPTSVWTPGPTDIPVLVSYHLAYLFRDPSAQVPLRSDWKRFKRLAAGQWPERFPSVSTDPPLVWPPLAAFDTEYVPETRKLVRYSVATPDRAVWVVEADDVGAIPMARHTQVILHNAPVDLAFLAKVIPLESVQLDDTMFAHAVLWGGREPKDSTAQRGGVAFTHKLNYLGSLYGRTNRHKHLAAVNPIQYAAGDALHTLDAWMAMQHEFQRDPESWAIYANYQRPLLPLILQTESRGLHVNRERVQVAQKALHQAQADVQAQAQAAVGWPINLNSPAQVGDWLSSVEGIR